MYLFKFQKVCCAKQNSVKGNKSGLFNSSFNGKPHLRKRVMLGASVKAPQVSRDRSVFVPLSQKKLSGTGVLSSQVFPLFIHTDWDGVTASLPCCYDNQTVLED